MEMETKIYRMITALALIVAGAGWLLHEEAMGELKNKLANARGSVEAFSSLNESLEYQINDLQANKQHLAEDADKLAEKKLRIKEVTSQIDAVKKRTLAMAAEAEKAEEDLNDCVMDTRRAAAGKTFAAVKLRNGQELTSAKILRVNEDMVTVSHSAGTARLSQAEVPEEWVAKYQITPRAPASAITDAKSGSNPASGAAIGGANVKPSVTLPAADSPKAEDVHDLRARVAKLNAQIHILHGQAIVWRERAATLRKRFSDAEGKGRIVVDKARVDEAMANGEKCTAQATALEAEVIALQGNLYRINSGWR